MNASDYITQRLDDQIEWYDRKSLSNQRMYKGLRTIQFVAAALIPFLTAYLSEILVVKFVLGIMGVVIAVITALLDLYRFQEHWIEYRTTCESLKKEKFLFLTDSGPYGSDSMSMFQLLVQRVETLISKENSTWAQYVRQSESGEE